MCNFFSGILKKDGTILYSKTSDNHHAIMDDHKLKDEDVVDISFSTNKR